jgi:prepilin-type N-terminal cleavage/methylation domain-containing protein
MKTLQEGGVMAGKTLRAVKLLRKDFNLALKLSQDFFKKQFKEKRKHGLSLVEILIAIIIILILGGYAVVKGYRAITQSQTVTLSEFISKAEQAYVSLANNPLCQIPTNKQQFMNAVSDSQCRVDQSDHKGDYEFPDKIDNRWDWTITKSGTSVQLEINNVDPSRGQEVVKIHPECTYDSSAYKIICPLGTLPSTQ